jgi:FkbM family methyltransferase
VSTGPAVQAVRRLPIGRGQRTYDGPVFAPAFESFSQNGEDVVLWRALRGVTGGRYIDVGANDPVKDSVTMAFYSRGWSGVTVEPDPAFAALLRQHRPRDLVIEAAITTTDHDTAILHVVEGTGLSTLDDGIGGLHSRSDYEVRDATVPTRRLDSVLREAGWAGKDIHFMSVDTEGSERQVLESIDLTVWRPWVLVIEATEPNTSESTRHLWEHLVTAAGYQFCLFDGLSCFYVLAERAQQLGPALGYSACILDNYTTTALRECGDRVAAAEALTDHWAAESRELREQVIRWRAEAITRWAAAMDQATAQGDAELAAGRAEMHALHHERRLYAENAELLQRRIAELEASTSWRVTEPLRKASGLVGRVRGHR